MRVFHIGKYYAPFEGGIENFLAAFLKCSAKKNVEHFVLAHDHRLWCMSSLEALPEATLLRSATLARLLFAPISPLFYFQLSRHIKSFKPDVIHVHMPNLSAFWLLMPGAWRDCTMIIHWHADIVPSRKNILLALAYLFYRILEKRLLARAAAIIATSEPYLQTSKPLHPWRDKCHVIPLGLAMENPVSTQGEFWQIEKSFRLLCVGRLTYYKGQAFLIQAIADLPDIELIIVGTGKYQGRYQALLDNHALNDRARLLGHASKAELEALLSSCDCLCLPSIERTEAFGLVLLEAMQHGKPCICTNVEGSGMGWVVEDGRTGLVVASENTDSLRKAIASLNNNRQRAIEMGILGKKRFHHLFDIEQVTNKTLALYNQLQSGQPSAANLPDD